MKREFKAREQHEQMNRDIKIYLSWGIVIQLQLH